MRKVGQTPDQWKRGTFRGFNPGGLFHTHLLTHLTPIPRSWSRRKPWLTPSQPSICWLLPSPRALPLHLALGLLLPLRVPSFRPTREVALPNTNPTHPGAPVR